MPTTLEARYHCAEEYFFAAICSAHRRFNACVNLYLTDERHSAWNLLLVRLGSAPLGEAMRECTALMRASHVPIRLVVRQEHVEGLAGTLETLGCVEIAASAAMVLDLAEFAAAPHAGSAGEISVTRNLAEWAGPVGSAFGLPGEATAHYQARHQQALDRGAHFYHFILSTEGKTLSALTLTLCDGLARLNDIGTDPAHRRNGYSTRLIHAALAHATQLGARWVFLEASAQGLSLYHTLGFRRLFEYRSFVRAGCSDALEREGGWLALFE